MIWPWLIGGAIALIAAATGSNKSSMYASEYRAKKRLADSEKVIKTILRAHHEKVSERQQQLQAKERQLLEDKHAQDRKSLKALQQRLAKAKSQDEKGILSKQIKFYKNEIRKNSRLIAENRKLLPA